jgi:hypothetical protein
MVLSLIVGAIWSVANVFFIAQLVRAVVLLTERSSMKIHLFLWGKFPALYFTGYTLLNIPSLSTVGLLIGFTIALLCASLFLALRPVERQSL